MKALFCTSKFTKSRRACHEFVRIEDHKVRCCAVLATPQNHHRSAAPATQFACGGSQSDAPPNSEPKRLSKFVPDTAIIKHFNITPLSKLHGVLHLPRKCAWHHNQSAVEKSSHHSLCEPQQWKCTSKISRGMDLP